jgi:uncharacterized membrane protein YphA (DoxX/SURF4 family)
LDRTRLPEWLSLAALCAAYIQGGYEKVFHFQSALAEIEHFCLPRSSVLVCLSILVEWGGPLLILAGCWRWLGALALAGFTCYASWIANRFWVAAPDDAMKMTEAFYEHVGLAGGFVYVALADLRRKTLTNSRLAL